jgi:hypothetical protein
MCECRLEPLHRLAKCRLCILDRRAGGGAVGLLAPLGLDCYLPRLRLQVAEHRRRPRVDGTRTLPDRVDAWQQVGGLCAAQCHATAGRVASMDRESARLWVTRP